MADQLPCPNPTCTHVFALAALQASATVICPRCGFRMNGQAAPPRPAAPAKPAAPVLPLATPVGGTILTAQLATPAVPAAPVAPVAPVVPPKPAPAVSVPAVSAAVDLVKVPTSAPRPLASRPPVVASPPAVPVDAAPGAAARPRADGVRAVVRMAIILGAVGMACFLVIVGVFAILVGFGFATPREIFTLQAFRHVGKDAAANGRQPFVGRVRTGKGSEEKAFRLLLARDVWTPDKELRTHLGALGAWMNKQDDLWLAVAVKDFGTQKPRESELVKSGIERLEAHFGEGLELAAKTEPADFAGTAAQKLTFKGQLGAVVWWGECIMLSHHGFGYWIFLAGPTVEDTQPLEDELKKEETGFALETDRKGWREQPPRMEKFVSSDGTLTVSAAEGVWEKATQPNVEFETGTLLLLGRYLKERDNQKNAHLQALTLDGHGDLKEAMQLARDHLEKVKKEQTPGYKLAPVEGQAELGVVEDVGNRRGRLAEMALSLNDAPVRYYLVAVIGEPDRTEVVLCDCAWKSRQIWRQDFLGLLRTLKVKGNG